jgi:hypothetical protein
VSFTQRDDGDDQFGGVAERRVEKSADAGAGATRQFFSGEADQDGKLDATACTPQEMGAAISSTLSGER